MFNDISYTQDVSMTLQMAQKKLNEFQTSSIWNYVLLGTALLTFIVAARNISVYYTEIKHIKSGT